MRTSTRFNIIVIGLSAILLLIILRVIHIQSVKMEGSYAAVLTTNQPSNIFRKFNKMQPEPPKPNSEDTKAIHYDLRSPNQIAIGDKLRQTLATLGIVKDERTIDALLVAFASADISRFPDDWKDKPDVIATAAHALKHKIAYLLPSGTNADGSLISADPLTIMRVLECPLGIPVPPMADFEVREGIGGLYQEAKAIEKAQ